MPDVFGPAKDQQHPIHNFSMWQRAVHQNLTALGYDDWVKASIAKDKQDNGLTIRIVGYDPNFVANRLRDWHDLGVTLELYDQRELNVMIVEVREDDEHDTWMLIANDNDGNRLDPIDVEDIKEMRP